MFASAVIPATAQIMLLEGRKLAIAKKIQQSGQA
jgi:hypothetical protein